MSARVQVMKFGGTSVGNAECIARAAKIIAGGARDGGCVAVVSAMSGVTNRLIDAARDGAKRKWGWRGGDDGNVTVATRGRVDGFDA